MGAAARRGRLTDTEAISFSLLLLLARSATHAEGVTLFCPLSSVHCSLTTVHCPLSTATISPFLKLLWWRKKIIVDFISSLWYNRFQNKKVLKINF